VEEQRWLRQAEKDLKAFLYSKGLRAILTHSIRDLVLDCSRYEKDFHTLLSAGKTLDAYYVSTRYPDSLVGNEIPAQYYSEEDASRCINYAESMLKTVIKFMSN
jgi:HEPN domain-containing protein